MKNYCSSTTAAANFSIPTVTALQTSCSILKTKEKSGTIKKNHNHIKINLNPEQKAEIKMDNESSHTIIDVNLVDVP
jgi:hypothetical protein